MFRYFNYSPIPYSKDIIRTQYTARCDGDFVVFIIGARSNGANPFLRKFSDLGNAFQV
jgi:hypothetical protein